MSILTPTPPRFAGNGQRDRVVTDAVVSAYINEIAGPAHRHEHALARATPDTQYGVSWLSSEPDEEATCTPA